MASSAWTGAITFGGFPINLVAYNLVKSSRNDSFKTLCKCHGAPIAQKLHCLTTDDVVERDDALKGVETGKDRYSVLPPEALEQIAAAERTVTLEIQQFAPIGSVPLNLGTGHFRLVPDPKVAGAEQPASILWNGLHGTDRALVTEWTPRAGSRDAVLVVHAAPNGLEGTTLPWTFEFSNAPEHTFEEDENAQGVFEKFIEAQGYDLGDFALDQHQSSYAARRADAIAKAVAGEPIEVADAPTAAPAVPDLMAAMNAALDSAPAKAKPKKAKAKTPEKAAA